MPQQLFPSWLFLGYKEPLRPDVVNYAILLLAPVQANYKPQIEIHRRLGRNHVVRTLARLSGRDAVDIQRGQVQKLQQWLVCALNPTEPEFFLELLLIAR